MPPVVEAGVKAEAGVTSPVRERRLGGPTRPPVSGPGRRAGSRCGVADADRPVRVTLYRLAWRLTSGLRKTSMKNVTPPQHRTPRRRSRLDPRGASVVAGIALAPFLLLGLSVAGIVLAVGLIWAAAWAIAIAVAGAFLVAGTAGAVAVLRARQDGDRPPS